MRTRRESAGLPYTVAEGLFLFFSFLPLVLHLCEAENPLPWSRQSHKRVNKIETKRSRRGSLVIICHQCEGQSASLLILPPRTAERRKQIVYPDFQGPFISFNDMAL